MPDPKQWLNRRLQAVGNDALDAMRAAHRAIDEHSYHLYMEGGCDRSRVAEYWLLAAQAWLDSSVEQGAHNELPPTRLSALEH